MTNSANEPLPVDHDTAINDDTAEFDALGSSAATHDQRAEDPKPGQDSDGPDDSSDADDENDDPGGGGQFGADPQELQGDDPASGGS